MTLIPNDYQKEMNEMFEIFRKEIDALKAENKELKEQLHLHDVVGQSEQLPCDCGVMLKETTIQVFCPKCYKTWRMK